MYLPGNHDTAYKTEQAGNRWDALFYNQSIESSSRHVFPFGSSAHVFFQNQVMEYPYVEGFLLDR